LYQTRNIRTPLLLVHGDRDPSFNQSLQLFNTLKRLGDRPVVLLEYVGEDHDLEWGDGSAERDFEARTIEFFDHFLKDKAAPKWWSDGVGYYEGQAPAPDRASSNQ